MMEVSKIDKEAKFMKKLNVAIIGYGRSGCNIHGAFLAPRRTTSAMWPQS